MALDPKDAYARGSHAWFRLASGDAEGALAEFDACIAASPRASNCWELRLWIDSILGRCDANLVDVTTQRDVV